MQKEKTRLLFFFLNSAFFILNSLIILVHLNYNIDLFAKGFAAGFA